MNDRHFDVIVIGASLAGVSAALSFLEKKKSVLILDKSRFPRQKVCGEFLSPVLWPWFEKMGLKEKILSSGFHPVEKAYLYSPKGRQLKIAFEESALGLSRYSLDEILLNTAKEKGAVVKEESLVTEKVPYDDGWIVKVIQNGAKEAEWYGGKRIIDASGKPPVLRRNAAKETEMLGFQAHFQNVDNIDHILELFFFQEGYGGIVKVENNCANACFLLRMKNIPLHLIPGHSAEFMKWVFQRHPVLKQRMEQAVLNGDMHTTGPLSYGLKKHEFSETNVWYAGDALGVIDPFFGQGMTIAFQSGWMSGQCGNSGEFKAWVRENLGKRFRLAQILRKTAGFGSLLETAFLILGKSRFLSQMLFKIAHGY